MIDTIKKLKAEAIAAQQSLRYLSKKEKFVTDLSSLSLPMLALFGKGFILLYTNLALIILYIIYNFAAFYNPENLALSFSNFSKIKTYRNKIGDINKFLSSLNYSDLKGLNVLKLKALTANLPTNKIIRGGKIYEASEVLDNYLKMYPASLEDKLDVLKDSDVPIQWKLDNIDIMKDNVHLLPLDDKLYAQLDFYKVRTIDVFLMYESLTQSDVRRMKTYLNESDAKLFDFHVAEKVTIIEAPSIDFQLTDTEYNLEWLQKQKAKMQELGITDPLIDECEQILEGKSVKYLTSEK